MKKQQQQKQQQGTANNTFNISDEGDPCEGALMLLGRLPATAPDRVALGRAGTTRPSQNNKISCRVSAADLQERGREEGPVGR